MTRDAVDYRRSFSVGALLSLAVAGCGRGPVDLAAGGVTLHAEPDGSFRLAVGGRALLAGAARPVTVSQFDPGAPPLWGNTATRPGR